MPSHDAEAIVLRHYALSEADRIVVLLTREVGLLRAVAHGARRPKSRIGACLQPLNHIRLEYYLKEGADLSRLFQCETIHSYLGRTPSLEQIYGFTYFAELIQELSVENNPSPVAFRLLLAALNAGESLGFTEALLRYFEIWLLKLNGFMPNYDYCSSCGRCVKELGFYVSPETGQARCPECACAQGVRMAPESAGSLSRMYQVGPAQFAALPLPAREAAELEQLSQRLLELHLEKKLKSYDPLRQLLRGR